MAATCAVTSTIWGTEGRNGSGLCGHFDHLQNFTEEMAGATGLEPATSGSTVRSSNQLSYAPTVRENTSERRRYCIDCLLPPQVKIKGSSHPGATRGPSKIRAKQDSPPQNTGGAIRRRLRTSPPRRLAENMGNRGFEPLTLSV